MSRNLGLLHSTENASSEYRSPHRHFSRLDSLDKHNARSAVVDGEVIKLVQSVFILPQSAKRPDAVAFCGVGKGVGCSWVCARASEALAMQTGASVCVVDANLHSPSLHEYFETENKSGFADALRETAGVHEFVERIEGANIWLMAAGKAGDEPLHPSRVRARATELRHEFDFVLIDTPPLLSSGEARLLAQGTDGAVLVVGSNLTRRESARRAKESLELAGIPVLGAVLNKRIFAIPESIYKKL